MIGEERVHPATPRRREEARRAGMIPRSADLTRAAGLLAAAVAVACCVEPVAGAIAGWMKRSLSSIGSVSAEDASGLLSGSIGSALVWTAPVFAAILLIAVVVHGVQTGFAWTGVSFRLGGSSTPSRRAGVTGWSFAKFVLLAAVATWTIHQRAIPATSTAPAFAAALGSSIAVLMFRMGAAFLLLGLVDYVLERRRHEAELRMTDAELRAEQRDGAGDPRLKKQRHRLFRTWMTQD